MFHLFLLFKIGFFHDVVICNRRFKSIAFCFEFAQEYDLLIDSFDENLFSCGVQKVAGDSTEFSKIHDIVYTNPALTCDSSIEKVFFSCGMFDPICSYCGELITESEKKQLRDAESAQGGHFLPKCSREECSQNIYEGTRSKVNFRSENRAQKRARIAEQKEKKQSRKKLKRDIKSRPKSIPAKLKKSPGRRATKKRK